MSGAESISYQMFEAYYRRAVDAEQEGRQKEAKRMYLLASESLLKVAKTATGQTKAALVRRADKLQRISDAIVVSAEADKTSESASRAPVAASEKHSSEESGTIWTGAGKPNVHFHDIAGLNDVKESIHKRIILPRLHPDVYQVYRRDVNGGILLYGPPGTGKTMIAKAIACEVNAEFYSVRCSDVVGKYFGEAEKNIKSLFETARAVQSAVLFFDEFEALASHRGGNSTVMNRLVPELLSQMDGFSISESNSLLFLAATNRPWDIDSAFLRPPRLTEKIYVGLPDYEARLFLARRAFHGVPCDADATPEVIAELTDGCNAADVVSFCENVKDGPISRTIHNGGLISKVALLDIKQTAERVHSSVQKKDIEMIKRWEQTQGM